MKYGGQNEMRLEKMARFGAFILYGYRRGIDVERWSATLSNLKPVSFGNCVPHKGRSPVLRRDHG
jgi:hypothetical protein